MGKECLFVHMVDIFMLTGLPITCLRQGSSAKMTQPLNLCRFHMLPTVPEDHQTPENGEPGCKKKPTVPDPFPHIAENDGT